MSIRNAFAAVLLVTASGGMIASAATAAPTHKTMKAHKTTKVTKKAPAEAAPAK